MNRLIACILVLAALLGLQVTATAATSQGDSEITLVGSIQRQELDDEELDADEDDTVTMAIVGGAYGYFFTDELELTGQAFGIFSDDVDIYNIGVALKYHFLTDSDTVPYAGGQVNGSFFDADEDDGSGFQYGPLVGVKIFVSENTTLFGEYQYQFFGGDVGDFIENAHVIVLGVSFLFK